MRYLLLFILTLTSLLASCTTGYTLCKQKIKDSHSLINNTLFIPINKHQRVLYSQRLPEYKVVKADKFLGLYLVENVDNFKYPFKMATNSLKDVAAVNEKMVIKGKLTKKQLGLNSLANFSEVPFVPSLLITNCCNIEGIVTPRGIIEKEYLSHFISSKESDYGDIGIRIDEKSRIIKIDPFLKQNPFQVSDIIVEFDSKKIVNADKLMQDILFCKIGSKHKIKVLREKKLYEFQVSVYKRTGGGLISDTFLEQKGFYFNNDLTLKSVSGYELKPGDKLLSINGNRLSSLDDIPAAIGTKTEDMIFLFQRGGFQFFVHIN